MLQQHIQASLVKHTGWEIQAGEVAAAPQKVLQLMCIKRCGHVLEQQPG
jgi:hypothetical protein